jgi:hypothetical protein
MRLLFESERIKAVVTSNIVSDLQAGAILATRASTKVESVHIAHGDGPYIAEAWDLHELAPYKHYFVPNREFQSYFTSRRVVVGDSAAVAHVGSERWQEYLGWSLPPKRWLDRWDGTVPLVRRGPPGGLSTDKPIVVYVAAWSPGNLRYLNKPEFTEISYFRIQVAVAEELAKYKSVRAVLKLYPTDSGETAIARYISLNQVRITVSRAPLSNWMPWASRIIVDKPSTSMYQASLARVPLNVLVYRGFKFRPEALAPFSHCMIPFSTPAEAASAVGAFMRASDYARLSVCPDLSPRVFETLAHIINGRGLD